MISRAAVLGVVRIMATATTSATKRMDDVTPHIVDIMPKAQACADLVGRRDWSATALGPFDGWPASLKITLATMMRSPVPLAILWGADGIILYNQAFAPFAGARHPALFGASIAAGGSPFAASDRQALNVCLAGGTLSLRDRELTLDRATGPEPAWVDLDYSPIADADGRPAGALCVVSETTARVVAERRSGFLLTLADDLRVLASPTEIMDHAAQRLGRELTASRVFYAEITTRGWMTVERDYADGVASIVGRHSLESFGPDLLAAYRAGAPVVVRNVGADERLSDGAREGLTTREVGAFIDVVLFQEDEWVGLLAVQSATPRVWTPAEEELVQNVGERVRVAIERARAEVALRELKGSLERQVVERTVELRRYHEIVEASGSPIFAFDTDYRLIASNRAHDIEFRRVHGIDPVVGAILPDQFAPERRPVIRALMARALAGERFIVSEPLDRPEPDVPAWEISYTPLRDAAGTVIGAFQQANDISDLLVVEAELDSAQEALRQSQKVEAMGSLTGGVAHDFNNLLTPIIGSLDMLMRKGVGSERERRLIDGALQSAERAKTLVQRLLAFARRQPLQPTAVDLGQLVDGMADLIGSTLGPTITLAVDVATDLLPARADANQLEMALLNLAVNARDAMPAGGTLTIAARVCAVSGGEQAGVDAGDYICLSVADTGIGMDEGTRRRAIEPFFSTKGVGKGTGLGLSMVHGLAAQLGGGLTVDSAPGHGTRITLWLPISDMIVVEPAPLAFRVATADGAGTVLLVDDEDLVRQSTADMLADLGYAVVEASSGPEALALVRAGLVPDLLVTDHLMPGMSGAELARELGRQLPDLRSLVISGFAEEDGIDSNMARLNKPFRNDELVASLGNLRAPPTIEATLP
jgi:signal transduction histidine kinase